MKKNIIPALPVVPGFFWLMFFFAIPLLYIFLLGFASRGTYGGVQWILSFSNFFRVFEPIYAKIFFSSIQLSLIVTIVCLLLGYPLAYCMAVLPEQRRMLFLVALAIPSLMSLVIRIYAIKTVLGYDGPLSWLITSLGFTYDSFSVSQNWYVVIYGMVATYLPFMVYPIYSTLEKFDFSLVEAAQDLGANFFQVLFRVVIPSTKPAIWSGVSLVFIPTMGEFVIPDLLGGARTMLVGNLITEQFLKARDWPFGAALGVILILWLAILLFFFRKIERNR